MLLCEENEPRQRRRFQALLSALLRVQLREHLEESLEFATQVHGYEDHCGKPIQDAILAATVIAGINNATVAQHFALNDGTFDTYPKIMDAVRSFVRASRGWKVSADGDSMDVDPCQSVKWEESSRVTKVPFAESRRLLVFMESPSVIKKKDRKRKWKSSEK